VDLGAYYLIAQMKIWRRRDSYSPLEDCTYNGGQDTYFYLLAPTTPPGA
jgi:hypothetical protein